MYFLGLHELHIAAILYHISVRFCWIEPEELYIYLILFSPGNNWIRFGLMNFNTNSYY